MTRARKWMLGIGTALAVLLVAGALTLTWLLHTTAGLHFALTRGVAITHGQFGFKDATGNLADRVTLTGVNYRSTDGTTLRIDHAMLELRPWALLGKRLHVRRARIDGIALDIAPSTSPQPASGNPLQPPLTIALDDIVLTRIAIAAQHKPVFAADSLALAATWSKRELVLHELKLRAPAGSVDVDGQVASTPGQRGSARATIDWTQGGTRYRGTLVAGSDGKAARLDANLTAPIHATLHATLAQDTTHAWTLALAAPQFYAHALPGLPAAVKTLALALHGAGTAQGGKLTGTLAVNDHTVVFDPARFRYDGKTLTLDPLRLRAPALTGAATLTGTVERAATPHAALDLDWRDVDLPADLVGQPLATHGKLRVAGNSDAYRVQGALALGPPGSLSDVQVDLSGTRDVIRLRALRLVQAQGNFDTAGTLGLQPDITWKLAANATRFDPGAIFSGWNGALTFKLSTQGELTPQGPAASIRLDQASGSLRGQRIDGSTADASVTPGNLFAGTLNLIVGNSHLRASGKPGANTHADIEVDVASLGDWWPGATGALRGRFNVKGTWPKLAVSGHLGGSKLALDGRDIDILQLKANVPDIAQPGGDVDLTLAGVRANGFDFKSIKIEGSGSAAAHRLQLTASGTPLGIHATVQGSLQTPNGAWRGSLSEVELTPQGLPAWRQTQASALAWKGGGATLARFCLSAGAPQLCLAGARSSKGAINATYDLQKLPLQLLATLTGGNDPLLASGDVSGNGKLTLAANGALGGSASLATSAGQLAFASSANQPLLAWTRITAAATATGGNQHLALSGMLADGGHLNGNIDLRGSGALAGTLAADLRSLAFIGALSPEVANVKGSLTGTLQLGGTLAAPQFQGRIQTHDFSAELPRAGLKLHDGAFAVTGDPQGRLAITGRIGSGKGLLHVDGGTGLAADAPLQLAIKGDDVLVADIPAAHVVASPDLRLARNHGIFALTGSITIPDARVEAEKLPGQGPASASPDVVIVDAPPAAPVKPLALDANIVVKLGDAVKLHGYGLDGGVGGQLTISAKPGAVATARGQISVSGKYQAYGQDLDIERGRLLFAGTRLDNPGLDIRAVRKIQGQGITVGLAVRGTAQQPQLTVFSEPAMEQAEALSYLVTGRSMETLKSGEGDTLNTAAQALGGLAGDRLAKSIGSRLGIEAGVSSNAALGGTAFTAGKYLSPRLFLSYGVGLFTPGQVITLRYTLNRFLQFEAENATTGNRASLNYRIEK